MTYVEIFPAKITDCLQFRSTSSDSANFSSQFFGGRICRPSQQTAAAAASPLKKEDAHAIYENKNKSCVRASIFYWLSILSSQFSLDHRQKSSPFELLIFKRREIQNFICQVSKVNFRQKLNVVSA